MHTNTYFNAAHRLKCLAVIALLLLSGCRAADNSSSASLPTDSSVVTNGNGPAEDVTSVTSSQPPESHEEVASPPPPTSTQPQAPGEEPEAAHVNEMTAEVFTTPDAALFSVPAIQRKSFLDDRSGKKLPYRLFVPQNYEKTKKYPVLLFLHGAGERGTDNNVSLSNFKKSFETAGDLLKQSIIIAPQCPESGWWRIDEEYGDENGWLGAAMRLLNKIKSDYSCDSDRIYVTGLSMGGYATWSVLERYPAVFAAGVPVCGWGNPYAADTLKNIPIWIYHGTADRTVSYSSSESMYNAIKSAGGEMIELKPLYGVEHNAWDYSYTDRNMFCWLFSQSRKKAQSHNTDYEYIPIFEVKSPQNESVITEDEITELSYEYINDIYCCFAELTADGLYYLERAYKGNLGKEFTVYCSGTRFTPLSRKNYPQTTAFLLTNVQSKLFRLW